MHTVSAGYRNSNSLTFCACEEAGSQHPAKAKAIGKAMRNSVTACPVGSRGKKTESHDARLIVEMEGAPPARQLCSREPGTDNGIQGGVGAGECLPASLSLSDVAHWRQIKARISSAMFSSFNHCSLYNVTG